MLVAHVHFEKIFQKNEIIALFEIEERVLS